MDRRIDFTPVDRFSEAQQRVARRREARDLARQRTESWSVRLVQVMDSCWSCSCVRVCLGGRARRLAPPQRIQRYLSQMMLWNWWICCALFGAMALLDNERFALGTGAGEETSCPSEVAGTGSSRWDCFLTVRSDILGPSANVAVDCSSEGAPLDPALVAEHPYLVCYRLFKGSADLWLGTMSTLSSLLTIVIGGLAGFLARALAHIKHNPLAVRAVYLLPLCLMLLWAALLFKGMLSSPLSVLTPVVSALICTLVIKMRLAVGFARVDKPYGVDLNNRGEIEDGDEDSEGDEDEHPGTKDGGGDVDSEGAVTDSEPDEDFDWKPASRAARRRGVADLPPAQSHLQQPTDQP